MPGIGREIDGDWLSLQSGEEFGERKILATIITDDHGRPALIHHGQSVGQLENPSIMMTVCIDETGRQHEAVRA